MKAEDDLIRLWDEKHEAAGCPLYREGSITASQASKQRTLSLLWRTCAGGSKGF